MVQSSIVQSSRGQGYDLALKNHLPPLFNPQLVRDGVGASRVFCPPHTSSTVLDFLCQQFKAISPDIWRVRMDGGLVMNAQGVALSHATPYESGKHLFYFRQLAHEPRLPFEAQVLFQDEYLVVADKPHFLPVIPSGQYVQETLLVRLKKQLNLPYLSPLHRIDRDTAGLVLFSARPQDRGAYQNLFRDTQITKQYLAIARYLPGLQLPHTIRLHLEDASNFMQMKVNPSLPPNSLTQITAVTRLPSAPEWAQYTLSPTTGKRHQLRVHMLQLGAPLLGDQIYPELMPERDISQAGLAPLQLLAQRLSFVDPITGHARVFESARTLQLSAT